MRRGRKMKDLTGNQYGYLEALEPVPSLTKHSMVWKVICRRDNVYTHRTSSALVGNRTFSCGCTAKKSGPNKKPMPRRNVVKRIQELYPRLSIEERIKVDRIVAERAGMRERPLGIRLEAIQVVIAERGN